MNPLESLLQLLQQQAGPRGATFAGRALKPGEGLQEALQRVPLGEMEQGGIAMQSPELLRSLLLVGAFGPIRTPQQKQIVSAMWRRDPQLVRELQAAGPQLDIGVGGRATGGQLVSPGFGSGYSLEIHPSTLRGRVPQGSGFPGEQLSLPNVAIHEGQHMLTKELLNRRAGYDVQPMISWTERAKSPIMKYQGRPDALQYIDNSRYAYGSQRAFEEAVSIAREALADPKLPQASRDTLTRLMKELFKDMPKPPGTSTSGLKGSSGIVGYKEPPWLTRQLPKQLSRNPNIARDVAIPLSIDPQHPVRVLKNYWGQGLDRLTDTEIAAMVMSHSLQGGTTFKTSKGPVVINQLERLLKPEKLAELKKWALDTLQQAAQKKAK